MSRLERLQAEAARAKQASTWKPRMERLKKRKKDPINEANFCDMYDLNVSVFNRNKNGVTIPTEDQVTKVEAAFHAEGV